MRTIKKGIFFLVLLSSNSLIAQTESFEKSLDFKTNIRASFYHFGGYTSERSIFYLAQHISYNVHPKFSFGGGIGINSYPFLLAMPVFIEGKYHFKIKSLDSYFYQSYGRNVKIHEVFFNSNRNVGSFGVDIKLNNKIALCPELGYSLLWDKYSGGALSLFFGIGIQY